MNLCPCGSHKNYSDCCGPYVAGEKTAPSAEALMRSRYCAYVQGAADYLLRTWHPSSRPIELALDDQTRWQGLSIVTTEKGLQGDVKGMVEFIARFIGTDGEQRLHERSRFVFESGAWLYVDGVFPAAKKQGRNEPCCCGSGKKYKRCCGKG